MRIVTKEHNILVFELDSIRNWLNMAFTVDEKTHFVTNSFIIFNLDQVFSNTYGSNIEKYHVNQQ